ncbi:MAG: type II secretion system F family protein, partial [Actinomycetota bacterium]|nr:type II secretion system F family protein [Actinomycetota bacterium]
YESLAKTGQAKVEIEADIGGQPLKTSIHLNDLPVAKKSLIPMRPVKFANRLNNLTAPWFAATLAFLAVFLLVLALVNLFQPTGNILAEQLKYYDQLRGRKIKDTDKPKMRQARDSLVELVAAVSARYDFTNYAQAKLEQAGLPVKPNEYVTLHLMIVAAVSMLAFFLTGNSFAALLLAMIAVFGPLLAVQYKIEKRKGAFAAQLADTLDLIAGSMRAGFGLQQAIAAAGREAREPTAGELVRVSNQVQMGMSLEEALTKMAERVGDASFKWVVLAITIHRETGGNLAEILNNLAYTLRDRQTLQRQVKALAAEGRLSAIILIVLPFVEGALLFLLNPGYMSALVTTIPGALMLLFGLSLLAVGAIWMRKITIIEY